MATLYLECLMGLFDSQSLHLIMVLIMEICQIELAVAMKAPLDTVMVSQIQ